MGSMPSDAIIASERFRTALELFEVGVAIMRQNLRRRYPHANPEEIEARLRTWLRTRPGAESGDASSDGNGSSMHVTT
jgi:hypothetical protein